MPLRTLLTRCLIGILAALPAAPIARAQAPAAAPAVPAAAEKAPALTDSLRFDPSIRTGTLSNGMHFFIQRNQKPEARVSLRLAVPVGSTAEEDDQQGLAHFAEHMNFNGSPHFKDADDLVAFLQSIGLRFGADANAYTSFDETVYMLEVPSDRDTTLERGIMALSDFAGRATMSTTEIDKERGVVLEEWRLGRGAQERMLRKQFPIVFYQSRYANRLPIGKPEILSKAPPERLRAFYHDWYTPERMAVIAVGDVDPDKMERLIRQHFANLAPRADAKATPRYDVPKHAETLVSVATDKEATNTQVALYFKHPKRPFVTVADFRRGLAEELFSAMLNSRLDEIALRAKAPFLGAGAGSGSFGRSLDYYVLQATVAHAGVEKGLAALLDETARVRQHGFLDRELDRAKEELAAQNERAYAERDKSESSGFATSLVSSFLNADPELSIEDTYRLTKALLPGVTLADVNGRMQRLIHNDSRVVLVNAPEKKGAGAPSEAAIRAVLTKSVGASVAAWVDTTGSKPLMTDLPKPGAVASQRVIPEIGATVLTLSNGVEVWLKPTDFKADEIQFSAYSMGGLSLADSADFPTASMVPAVMNRAGVGGFKSTELQKMLSGKIIDVTPSLSLYTHGMSGSTRPADLATAFQLMYLAFTQPTEDPDAFAQLQTTYHTFLTDRSNSPEAVFQDTLSAVNNGRFYMAQVPTVAQFDAVTLKPVMDFYRQRMANAADFTFFFAGNFSVDSITPMVTRYLGSLPSTGKRTAAYLPKGPRYPKGISKVQVKKGVEPKATARITFFTTGTPLEELDLHRSRAAATILNDHLRETLREMLGGTYGASAAVNYIPPLPGYMNATIAFSCAPENLDKMIAATLDEVKKLREQGPSAEDIRKDQEVERRELEVSMKQNAYWTGSMQTVHMLGWDPVRISKRAERIELLTAENVRDTFRRYFPADRYTIVTLVPEVAATLPAKAKN